MIYSYIVAMEEEEVVEVGGGQSGNSGAGPPLSRNARLGPDGGMWDFICFIYTSSDHHQHHSQDHTYQGLFHNLK